METIGDTFTLVTKPKNSASTVGKTSNSDLPVSQQQPLNVKLSNLDHSNSDKDETNSVQSKSKILYDDVSKSSVGRTSFGLDQGVDVQIKKLTPQTGISYCPSPQNSFHSATQSIDAKESFSITKSSECQSIIEKASESSTYIESPRSYISDKSSLRSMSSVKHKPHKSNDNRWIDVHMAQARYGELHLKHFRILKQVGCGDIGKVYLSELVETRTQFAMKVMNKAALEKRKKLFRALIERDILMSLDHPFLPTLYTHFETEDHLCLVMEYCPGGDMHSLRQRQPSKCFPEHDARFYVAEVLLALEYLHMLGIIYRDLKPENVLVREDGHIMLSDFDLSLRSNVFPTLVKSASSTLDSKNAVYCAQPAYIKPACIIQPACFSPHFLLGKPKKAKKPKSKDDLNSQGFSFPELLAEPTGARSMSFVGTHEYLAPEIIKGDGHGSAVDWWTFGIFLYELLFGKTPFKGSNNNDTLFNVVGQNLKFPDYPFVSFAARDLIRGLLVKEPQRRLGYRRGATEIKQHVFFQSINWALIRCGTPPEVPSSYVLSHTPSANPPVVPSTGVNLSDVIEQFSQF